MSNETHDDEEQQADAEKQALAGEQPLSQQEEDRYATEPCLPHFRTERPCCIPGCTLTRVFATIGVFIAFCGYMLDFGRSCPFEWQKPFYLLGFYIAYMPIHLRLLLKAYIRQESPRPIGRCEYVVFWVFQNIWTPVAVVGFAPYFSNVIVALTDNCNNTCRSICPGHYRGVSAILYFFMSLGFLFAGVSGVLWCRNFCIRRLVPQELIPSGMEQIELP